MYDNIINRHLLPMVQTTNSIGFIPQQTSITTNNHIFKYMIGDVFADPNYTGDTIEITGFNYLSGTYQGVINMKFGKKYSTQRTNLIFESRLDRMNFVENKKVVTVVEEPKNKVFNYRIHYFSPEVGGTRSLQRDVRLSNVRALAKLLNTMVKTNSKQRIIMVSVLDENGIYLSSVKFLKREIKEQKFLTGMKERLLAHAKYECGYEVAINF